MGRQVDTGGGGGWGRQADTGGRARQVDSGGRASAKAGRHWRAGEWEGRRTLAHGRVGRQVDTGEREGGGKAEMGRQADRPTDGLSTTV